MSTIQVLAKRWYTAKQREAELAAERLAIEAELVGLVESKMDGQVTSHVDGWKITVKCPVNRSLDTEKWEAIRDSIPLALQPVKSKLALDEKGCKYLAEKEPELWATCAQAITEKPGKPGFSIEPEAQDGN